MTAFLFSRALMIPLAVLAMLRVAYFWEVAHQPLLAEYWILDAKEYVLFGRAWASGGAPFRVFEIAPLYAYLMGIATWCTSQPVLAVIAVQQLFGVATAGLVGIIAGRLSGSSLASGVAASLYGLCGASALLEAKILPAAVPAALVTGAVALLLLPQHRALPRLCAAGMCLGLAALARPDVLLLTPLVAFWVWRDHGAHKRGGSRWKLCAAFSLGVVVSVAPATLHNYRSSGRLVLISSQGPVTFYHGNNPLSDGAFAVPEGFTGAKATQDAEARALAERAEGRRLTPEEVDRYWRTRAIEHLTGDVRRGAWLVFAKVRYWLGSTELSSEYTVPVERELSVVFALFVVPFGVILGLAALGLANPLLPVHARTLLLSIVAANLVVTLIFYFASRYRLMSIPALSILGGVGAAHLAAIIRRAHKLSWPVALAAALMVLSLSSSSSPLERQASVQWYNFGNEAFRRGELTTAVRLYERAVSMRAMPDAYVNLGQAHAQLGNYPAAVASLQKAFALSPGDAEVESLMRRYKARL